jgi:hypothetical protein
MGADVAEDEQSSGSGGVDTRSPSGAAVPEPAREPDGFRLDGLMLLGRGQDDPVAVDDISLVFDDQGVSVVSGSDPPRVLPWTSLSNHAVEAWTGGVLPEWWVDPELEREDLPEGEAVVIDTNATNRPFPETESGALINLRTPFATYRFLLPGGDADELAPRVEALARAHLGPSATSTVTTVARTDTSGPAGWRRDRAERTTWQKVQPVLVVLLVLVLITAVTLILLQSAGTIHIPFLGGANPGGGAIGPVSRP